MANESDFSWPLYHQAPIIGIIRNMPKEAIYKIASCYLEAGFYTLEVTMNTKGVLDIIASLRRDFPKLNIGAGTVCSLEDLNNAYNAGAQFIVTPIINEEAIKKSVDMGLPTFPGAYTPTEIYKAWSLGAAAVKVFPATQLGPLYLKNVLAPLNQIKLLPTGGVALHNIKAFFEAGAFGVGMGSSLLEKQKIQTADFVALKQHFLHIKAEINDFLP